MTYILWFDVLSKVNWVFETFFDFNFQAPEEYLRNQLKSYGGNFEYTVTYGGYEIDDKSLSPDVFITDGEISLLFYSGYKLRPNEPKSIVAQFDPYRWRKPSGRDWYFSKIFKIIWKIFDLPPKHFSHRRKEKQK